MWRKPLILGIVRAMLADQIGIREGGCGVTAVAAWPLREPELGETMRTFKGVASEVDEFPSGDDTRELWLLEVLRIKDAEAAE